jgi:hypothetical protein
MKKLLLVLLLISFMISFFGFASKDNKTNAFHTFDTKKFIKAANELSLGSPLNKINNSQENKSALDGNNWSDDAKKTLVSAGFNPDIFRPQEIFGIQTKEFTMPMDSNTDAMSVRTYNGQAANSNYGYSVASAGDVNGDGYDDIIIGAPYYNSSTGRVYIYYGGLVPHYTPDVVLNGEAPNNYFGTSVSTAGDVNGDGYADVIVGAYGYNSGIGRAYIYYGGAIMNNVPHVIMTGEAVNNNFGFSVSTAGDVNGDGYSDVIVGAYRYSSYTGRAYIYYGGASMDNVADVTMTGEAANNYFGYFVSTAGDANGDGYADVIVGAPGYSTNTGRAYIYYGGSPMNNVSDVIMTGEAINNYFGWSVSTAGDVNGDGYADVIVGAYQYSSGTGRAYIYYGGSLMDNVADVILTGETANDNFGISVSTAGDVNGDGYADVIVGASGYNGNTGRVYVYFGGASMNNIADITLNGEVTNNYFGSSVSTAGDVNGDGYKDIIVGANGYSTNTGRAYVYVQSMTGTNIPDLSMTGEAAANSNFGFSVSNAGDVNGDGYADVIVGAYYYNSGQGRAYIYYGGSPMNNVADVILTGEAINNYFGYSVSTAGDVNGDGYADVIIGAPNYSSSTGRAYIYYGGLTPHTTPDVIMTGEAVNNNFGYSVSKAGDVNGDGYSDVIVGAYGYSSYTGRAYIYFGGASMDNIADVTMTGEATSNFFGVSVSTAGDVNGDGYSDIIVGASGYSSYTGRAYIYYGGAPMDNIADVTMTGEAVNNYFGSSVSTAGDVNGDGYSDVIVGAPYSNSNKGGAYIFYGGAPMDNVPDVIMTGEAIGDLFGNSVSTAGDINGDGYSDVIVGAPGYSYSTGRAYIYFGGAYMDNVADVIMTGEAYNNNFGYSVSTAGDVNSDGYADVIVGTGYYNSNTGKTYIYITHTPPVKPTLVSVKDVPKDQGGKVLVKWARSCYDVRGQNIISNYLVQRSPAPIGGGYAWENIASVVPSKESYYSYVSNTYSDSVPTFFRITAQTYYPNEFWRSNIMSGISIDNLPPAKVMNLVGNMDSVKIFLHWKKNTEPDLGKYRIYRNDILIAERTDTTLNDLSVLADSTYKYRVAAVDIHSNEGPKSDSLQFVFGQLQLNLTVLIQGFYDNVSGLMVKDTVAVLLKNITTPYSTIDSVRTLLDSLGQGTIKLPGTIRNGTFYVVIRHRNSLETWSTSGGVLFNSSNTNYNFTTAITQAFGSNLLLKGTKWCIISGDVNQDGSIDALDRSACWNDRNLSGYYATDLNGDGVVDALDRSIVWNNRNLAVQKPALVLSPNSKGIKQNKKVDNENSKGKTFDLKLDGSKVKKMK